MKLLLTFLLIISTSILAVNSFNFLNPFGHVANKFCYVKVNVPVTPFKFYNFRDWDAKIAANQDLYNRRAHIVWVDAPRDGMCENQFVGGRCCLQGYFNNVFEWTVGPQGQKTAENQKLWAIAQQTHAPEYQVWVDAPDRYCRSSSIFGF